MINFHYAMSLMDLLYGTTMQEEEFEEIGLIAWNFIGNKRCKIHKYTACTDENNSIELPCNADILEAVVIPIEDWNYVTNDKNGGDINSAFVENYIEHRKKFHDTLYTSGKYLDYNKVGNTLYFDKPYSNVLILYKGVVLDEDDLPELTEDEAIAIATYCAYVSKFKEGLITNNAGIIQIADVLKQKWNVYCDAARVEIMSQNDWDNVLDAKVNHNRKIYGKSFKPFK